jgi:ferredoxin-NADP reductase
MTSLQLLLWIVGSLLLQLAVYLGIGFWRHLRSYSALRDKVAELEIDVSPNDPVEVPDDAPIAWKGLRAFRVTNKVTEDTAQSICSFELAAKDGKALPPFLPGQFLTFALDIPGATGIVETVVRCYSLSDAPHPERYRVSIKRAVPPVGSDLFPGLSSNFFHDRVAVGSVLQVRAPAGHFYIDQSNAPVVLIAGGVGITPMLSMLNWSLTHQPGREVWLFYGVRYSGELVMESHLQALAEAYPHFHLHLCLSNPIPDDSVGQPHRRQGRIDVALLRLLLPLKPHHFYICGPTPMLQSLVPALEDWGVPDAHIHFEAFGPASISRKKKPLEDQANADDSAIVVTFAKSGKQIPWQSGMGSLLDLAEANGVQVDSGCRAGGCGTCQTTIAAGEVGYRQLPDFDPEPGNCLLCICHPKTNLTLEA